MTGYVRLDVGIVDSSLWLDRDARDLFVTALLLARPRRIPKALPQYEVEQLEPTGWMVPAGWYGFIEASGPGLAHRALVPWEQAREALHRLGSPDADSKSPRFGGRRLVRVAGGYLALNFVAYRERDYTGAQRAARYRSKKKSDGSETVAAQGRRHAVTSRSVTHADADADADEHTPEGSFSGGGIGTSEGPCGYGESVAGATPTDTSSGWAVKIARARKGEKLRPEQRPKPRELEAAFVRALREIRAEPVKAARASTAAEEVAKLWRALGRPDVHEFAGELSLVARAAQMSRAHLFARDVRAEGWPEGSDRTHEVATICRQRPWDDRLREARKWEEATGRRRAGAALVKRRRPLRSAEILGEALPEPTPMLAEYVAAARAALKAHGGGEVPEWAEARLVGLERRAGSERALSAVVRVVLDAGADW